MELINKAIKEIENKFAEVLTSHGYDSYEKADIFYQWYCNGLMDAIGILLDMEAEEPHWIPCSERLPESDGYYLVTNSKWGAPWREIALWMTDGWSSNNEPIAWMPLPEPWKGEDNGI